MQTYGVSRIHLKRKVASRYETPQSPDCIIRTEVGVLAPVYAKNLISFIEENVLVG
jgi:hypothetical protein